MTHADNGFGELVSLTNPYGHKTTVYTKDDGKLAHFVVDSGDHEASINAVRRAMGHVALGRGRWDSPPVLALIKGGKP